MRLRFQKWYEEKVNNGDAKELFNEGCLCYKVGAYRAAFLMSYLGFQSILKERILKTRILPEKFPENKWEEIQNKLRDDKVWDDEVTESVNRTKPSNIFLISDDLRKQYQYFRVIRNDCAHAKSNIISYPHVESLWLFIESNYNKFVVNGGKNGLLERIDKHYDPNYTKPGSDVSPIVEDITTSMNIEEIPLFLKEVYTLLSERFSIIPFENDECLDFWKSVIFSEKEELRESVIKFVQSEWRLFLRFIDNYPEKLNETLESCEEEFLREFWNEQIFSMCSPRYTNGWVILEKAIKSEIIPDDELERVVKKIAKEIGQFPPGEQLEFFKSIGYLDELKREHFESGDKFGYPQGIYYGNSNWRCIKHLITNIKLDYNVVSQLNKAFLSSKYGTYHDGMIKLLGDNKEFRKEYTEILIKNDCQVPEIIQELEN